MDLLLHWELHLCRHMNEMFDAQWPCCISTVGFLNNAQILNSSTQLQKKDFSVPKGTKHEIFHCLQVCEQPIVLIGDRKSTRLNSSHLGISYAVFCLKKKKTEYINLSI